MAAAGVLERTILDDLEPKAFGARLRLLRQRAGMTRPEFAVALGMDADSRIPQSWEQGLRIPRTLDLPKIAHALNCRIEEFFDDPSPDEMESPRGRPKKPRAEDE